VADSSVAAQQKRVVVLTSDLAFLQLSLGMNVGGPGGAEGSRDKQPDDEDDDFEDEVRILFELGC
jgi:hypothetical protein